MVSDQDIALRCYTRKQIEKKYTPKGTLPWVFPSRVLVFDTETTADERLSLTFGCCKVYLNGSIERVIVFYSDLVKYHEMDYFRNHTSRKGYDLVHINEFREIFLLLAYEMESLVMGYNLPFDLSRIALDTVPGRGYNHWAFSVKLSENPAYPRLIIQHVDNARSFIKFSSSFTRMKGSNKYMKKNMKKFQGNFVDLRTMVYSFTNDKNSLRKSCEHFDTPYKKQETKGHGKITPEYIEYNEADVDATYSLFQVLMEEYKRYYLDLPITKLFSPASIGKAYLKMMGVRSFHEKNPKFPDKMLGYQMSAFYGGRSEVHIRKSPVEIAYMDVLSMYPTVNVNMGLWKYVISDHIDYFEDTEKIKDFVQTIDLEKLKRKETWKDLNAICLILPDGEIFPVRSKYGTKQVFNIGLNHLTSEKPIWYTLADVISAKILSGKEPKIIQAYRFFPVGIQKELRNIKIIGNIEIDPERKDLFKTLIEERKRIQKEMSKTDSEIEKRNLDSEQYILKIITNATSYGIFVQLDTNRLVKRSQFDVYGLDSFSVSKQKSEKFGKMFNPIIGTFITSASRLMLAICERILMDMGETYAFCDTDSMAVPVHCVEKIQEYFRNLNPYSFPSDVFKMEKENFELVNWSNPKGPVNKNKPFPLWFYGISSKRYVLFNIRNGERIIRKMSLHGLGHILNPFSNKEDWQEKIWEDILDYHYCPERGPEILDEYSMRYAVSRLTISTPDILKRFEGINKDLPYDQRIKPFNFACVGTSVRVNDKTGKAIQPITPFSSQYYKVPFGPFIDYRSKDRLQGTEYWQSMDDVLFDYMNHPESKFEGDKGVLTRKHVKVRRIVYIGKESDKLDETSVLGVGEDGYLVYNDRKWQREQIRKDPHSVSYREAEEMGISRSTLKRWRKLL